MKHFKLILVFAVLFFSTYTFSQDSYEKLKLIDDDFSYLAQNAAKKGQSKFLEKFSLGIKGGVNFSLIIPFERAAIFSGQVLESYEKDYDVFAKNTGMQMGFILMYDITQVVKISLQPGLNNYAYKYKTMYEWAGRTNIQYESAFTHRIRFFELPLMVGFYTTYNTFQPYLQAGIYYGRLLGADSQIKVVETSSNLGTSSQELEYETAAYTAGVYSKNHFGALAGAGISYLKGNMRIGLEANYRLLVSALNTTETQYMNNQIVSGGYDVPDKFKFSNLAITLNLIVSLSSKKQNQGGGAGSAFCPSYQ